MKSLLVNLPGREYRILIERGILEDAGSCIRNVVKGSRLVVVTDEHVDDLYGATLLLSLEENGFEVHFITVAPGEESKSLKTLEAVCEEMMDFGLTRIDAVVALGGGVIGDLAGFAAATALRGVDFIQIPTTLLAQVDSSVGGKVAVNLKAGKNLIGAFHQPRLVLIDPDCLDSLPDRVYRDGMGEVIKCGAIMDRDLFHRLEQYRGRAEVMEDVESVILDCCSIKLRLVEQDEQDNGVRMLLNFGHTLGHAYEKACGYGTYTHGEAVAAGMCRITAWSEKEGLTEKGTFERLRSLIRRYGLPDEIRVDREDYEEALGLDKKGEGDRLKLVLLKGIGNSFLHQTTKKEFVKELES